MCSTKAQPEKAGWKSWVKRHAVTAAPGVFTSSLVIAWLEYKENWLRNYGPGSQYELDEMLKTIVTAPYNPIIFGKEAGTKDDAEGRTYIPRHQDADLRKKLRDNINGKTYGFFMLVGESGSGRTTLMQTLLQKEYKEGVLEVSLSAEDMIKRREDKPFIVQLEEEV